MKRELQTLLKNAKEQNELDSKRVRDAGVAEERVISCGYIPGKKIKRQIEEQDQFYISDEIPDLQDEVKIQQNEIEGLTDLVNIMREEKKELTMELTSARLLLGWKDTEIKNLKEKINMFGDENELKKGYLDLEKEMQSKLQGRDNLLDEAKTDLLEEMRMKEEAYEDIEKLEKEILEKDDNIAQLQIQVEDLQLEVSAKTNALEMMENHIEAVECSFDEDIKELERQCSKLEKELITKTDQIVQLTEQLGEGDENHQQQLATLQVKLDQLYSEKELLEKDLHTQTLEFDNFKMESENKLEAVVKNHEEERLRMLLEFEVNLGCTISDTKVKYEKEIEECNNQITKLQNELSTALQNLEDEKVEIERKLEKRYDEKVVEVIIESAELHELAMKNIQFEFNKEKAEYEKKLLDLSKQLETESRARESVREQCETAVEKLKQSLQEKFSKIEELEKKAESVKLEEAKIDSNHLSEIAILEKSLKQQIQETNNQMSLQAEKAKEIEKLQKDLTKMKLVCEDLKRVLKNKEHDVQCSESKMAAYNNMLPTLQSELQHQRNETAEYKQRCEDQLATILSMEQDNNSFQANQKEIISRYEDQLKKAKDDNETLKKEVARLTTTFYKSSTPTPKKYLEVKIEDVKRKCEELVKQNDELTITNQKLQEAMEQQQKAHVKWLSNENKAESMCSEPINVKSDIKKTSSASKLRSRRTRAAAVLTGSCTDDEAKPMEKQKQSRKKLWDANVHDQTSQFENIEVDINVPQESPGTYVRRTLRNRNKLAKSTRKGLSEPISCMGCCYPQSQQGHSRDTKLIRRKLFSQDENALHSLNM